MIGPVAGTTKVAVVGAGSVGATLAYACLVRGIGRTIALYDVNADKTRAEVLDLNHGLQFVPQATVIGSDDIEVCRGADLVVITAGAKQKPGQTRLELAEANAALSRTLVPRLLAVAPDAILLLVTNPVDVVTYAALTYSGLSPQRVFGSVPLLAWDVPGRPPLDAATRDEIVRRVIGSAGEIIRGKGATNYAVGLAAARIIEAVLDDQRQVLPVSSLLDGRAGIGIHDVCLSLPSVVDGHGVDTVLPGPLSEDQAEGLRRSADTVRGVIKRLGL